MENLPDWLEQHFLQTDSRFIPLIQEIYQSTVLIMQYKQYLWNYAPTRV